MRNIAISLLKSVYSFNVNISKYQISISLHIPTTQNVKKPIQCIKIVASIFYKPIRFLIMQLWTNQTTNITLIQYIQITVHIIYSSLLVSVYTNWNEWDIIQDENEEDENLSLSIRENVIYNNNTASVSWIIDTIIINDIKNSFYYLYIAIIFINRELQSSCIMEWKGWGFATLVLLSVAPSCTICGYKNILTWQKILTFFLFFIRLCNR